MAARPEEGASPRRASLRHCFLRIANALDDISRNVGTEPVAQDAIVALTETVEELLVGEIDLAPHRLAPRAPVVVAGIDERTSRSQRTARACPERASASRGSLLPVHAFRRACEGSVLSTRNESGGTARGHGPYPPFEPGEVFEDARISQSPCSCPRPTRKDRDWQPAPPARRLPRRRRRKSRRSPGRCSSCSHARLLRGAWDESPEWHPRSNPRVSSPCIESASAPARTSSRIPNGCGRRPAVEGSIELEVGRGVG